MNPGVVVRGLKRRPEASDDMTGIEAEEASEGSTSSIGISLSSRTSEGGGESVEIVELSISKRVYSVY
jgi:hypothetical protein